MLIYSTLITVLLLILPKSLYGDFFTNPFLHFIQSRLCDSVRLEGVVSDCSCDFRSVDESVSKFFLPLLKDLTSRSFFRYFRVDLEKPCPFWHEDGQCMMEACSVCTCEENEVPRTWLNDFNPLNLNYEKNENKGDGFGWISSPTSGFGSTSYGSSESIGRLNMSQPAAKAPDQQVNGDRYLKYLRDTEDDGKYSHEELVFHPFHIS
jgi:hypothetical protein